MPQRKHSYDRVSRHHGAKVVSKVTACPYDYVTGFTSVGRIWRRRNNAGNKGIAAPLPRRSQSSIANQTSLPRQSSQAGDGAANLTTIASNAKQMLAYDSSVDYHDLSNFILRFVMGKLQHHCLALTLSEIAADQIQNRRKEEFGSLPVAISQELIFIIFVPNGRRRRVAL